jgi:hypothetical protein
MLTATELQAIMQRHDEDGPTTRVEQLEEVRAGLAHVVRMLQQADAAIASCLAHPQAPEILHLFPATVDLDLARRRLAIASGDLHDGTLPLKRTGRPRKERP